MQQGKSKKLQKKRQQILEKSFEITTKTFQFCGKSVKPGKTFSAEGNLMKNLVARSTRLRLAHWSVSSPFPRRPLAGDRPPIDASVRRAARPTNQRPTFSNVFIFFFCTWAFYWVFTEFRPVQYNAIQWDHGTTNQVIQVTI